MNEFNKDYFSTYYGNYYIQNPPRKLRAYLEIIKRHKNSGRLLDVGCSYGVFVQAATGSFHCVGMDVNHGVVAAASANVPDASFVVAAMPGIPFAGLDVITILDVMEHLPDPDQALVAIRRALAPGGIALVVIPVYDGPLGWLVHLLDKDPTHIHKCSRQYWLQVASRHFELVQWGGIFRKLIFGRFFVNIMTGALRSISPAVFMVVRRPN